MQSTQKEIVKSLSEEVREFFFNELSLKNFTPVQLCTTHYFLHNYDCIVQAPTGSGKTLAYIIPTIQLLKKCRTKDAKNSTRIFALILVPSRDLVTQVASVLEPLCKKMEFSVARLVGGGGAKANPETLFEGDCVVVATPGRLSSLLEKMGNLKNWLKSLEVLIIDEADRFSDVEFRKSISEILSSLPKQRRTGLFSATQAKDMEELVKFGLRNPIRLNVTGQETTINPDSDQTMSTSNVAPEELTNHHTFIPADQKLLALINFLKERKNSKILVFFWSSACVEYLAKILPQFLKGQEIVALHGKKKFTRSKIIEKFRKSQNCVMLSTDLMGRGIDVVDIDWVVQFDIPKHSSWFVHRSGRSGRAGRLGQAVVFLTHEESAYAKFLETHEKISFNELKIKGLTEEAAKKIRAKVIEIASSDREILELGTRAFVSFIQAYSKHDSQIVCKLKDLDIIGLAHSYGLLRIPIMLELKSFKLGTFKRTDIETSKISFKDPKRELERQKNLTERQNPVPAEKKPQKAKSEKIEKEKISKKRKRKQKSEWEELQEADRLLKKFKKGKLSKEEVNKLMDKEDSEPENNDSD
uniref:ATP-dependent RNA helicase n=2 Tax=Acrobeloides nanus TaxID=290746 RepID=A0A914C373_9BILA